MILIAAAFIFMWWMKNQEKEEISQSIRPPVYVMKPQLMDLRKEVQITAYVESESMVTVLPRVSGYLTSLKVDMGDKVEKGDIIGEVERDTYELQLQQAEAAYLAAQSTYGRVKSLYDSGATTQQNYDQVMAQYNASKSQWELAKLQVEYTNIEAPITGVVLKRHSSTGSMVAPQIPLVTLGKIDDLVLRAKIPEQYYSFFSRNQGSMTIEINVPALGSQILEGRLRRVSPYISPETKNFEALCAIKAENTSLRPGMFANANFILEEKRSVFALPFSALVSGKSLWFVNPQDKTAQKMDFTLDYNSETHFQVPRELADYFFIYEGQHFLGQGQKVRLLNGDEFPELGEEAP